MSKFKSRTAINLAAAALSVACGLGAVSLGAQEKMPCGPTGFTGWLGHHFCVGRHCRGGVPHGTECTCPPQGPFFGHFPTCWHLWPAGWTGCPVQDWSCAVPPEGSMMLPAGPGNYYLPGEILEAAPPEPTLPPADDLPDGLPAPSSSALRAAPQSRATVKPSLLARVKELTQRSSVRGGRATIAFAEFSEEIRTQPTPTQSAPTQSAPTQSARTQSAPTQSAWTRSTRTRSARTRPTQMSQPAPMPATSDDGYLGVTIVEAKRNY